MNMEVQMLRSSCKREQRSLSRVCSRRESFSQCTELKNSGMFRELLGGSKSLVRMIDGAMSLKALYFLLFLCRHSSLSFFFSFSFIDNVHNT